MTDTLPLSCCATDCRRPVAWTITGCAASGDVLITLHACRADIHRALGAWSAWQERKVVSVHTDRLVPA